MQRNSSPFFKKKTENCALSSVCRSNGRREGITGEIKNENYLFFTEMDVDLIERFVPSFVTTSDNSEDFELMLLAVLYIFKYR